MRVVKRKVPEPQPYFCPTHWAGYLAEQERKVAQSSFVRLNPQAKLIN